jgi:MFS transporter, DHA2 family, triacylglyceride efflux pump
VNPRAPVASPAPATADRSPWAGSGRRAAVVAGAAVLVSSADTYVIVLALPAMIGDLGIGLDRLQEATPIISGFLLGYVVVMPLLGRLADTAGRRIVLLGCLAVFAAGSLVTASAHDLASAVAGRALQGLGGGGLVPVTLALVADHWPARRRGVPLGAVGVAQEAGSVAGPLYGALILSVSTWRTIFWLNLPIAAALAAAFALVTRARDPRTARLPLDGIGLTLSGLALAAGALSVWAPEPLVDSVTFGNLYVAWLGTTWLTPLLVVAVGAAAAFLVWRRRRRHQAGTARTFSLLGIDWPGAALLALCLGAIVAGFSTGDPSREAVSPSAVWLLPLAAGAAGLFVWRERRAVTPLIAFAAYRHRAAYGALLTNLAVGAALMTALLDIPILARATVYPTSQLGAALVLLRMLVAVPVGAIGGGWLAQRAGNRLTAALGLAITAVGLGVMTRWSATTLADPLGATWLHPSDPVLVACGLGFGLAIAPVNAAILGAVRQSMHGVASALVVVARVVGMLVGVSVLTAIGLHAFFATAARLPAAASLCPATPLHCAAYDRLVTDAIVDELRVVFLGAAICAAVAACLALLLLGGRRTDLGPARA